MVRLCEIPSPSRPRGAGWPRPSAPSCASWRPQVSEDDAGTALQAGCGNIVARFPGGPRPTPVALRRPPQHGAGPSRRSRSSWSTALLTNRHPTILGGDDKSAVATLLTALRRIRQEEIPHAGVELVFTPCEEIGLRGRRGSSTRARLHRADGLRLRPHRPTLGGHPASRAVAEEHPRHLPRPGRRTPASSPRRAEAPCRPPHGRSPGCRSDGSTPRRPPTWGRSSGGTATDVVAERCTVTAECPQPQRAPPRHAAHGHARRAGVGRPPRARSTSRPGSTTSSPATAWASRDPQVALAAAALRSLGLDPRLRRPAGAGPTRTRFLRNGLPAGQPLQRHGGRPHRPTSGSPVRSRERQVDLAPRSSRLPAPSAWGPRASGTASAPPSNRGARRRAHREACDLRATAAASGAEVEREVLDHPGAVVILPGRARPPGPGARQPREAVEPPAGAARGQARRARRVAAGVRPARAGRGGGPQRRHVARAGPRVLDVAGAS